MIKYKYIGIIGCGGIGSNLGYFLSRHENISGFRLILVDHDKIETGNLTRQFYTENNIGENKAHALRATLAQFQPRLEVHSFEQKIETEQELDLIFTGLDRSQLLVIITTDNVKSKRVISKWARSQGCRFLIAGCNTSGYEISSQEQRSIWEMSGSAYSPEQNARTNILCANKLYELITLNKMIDFPVALCGEEVQGVMAGDIMITGIIPSYLDKWSDKSGTKIEIWNGKAWAELEIKDTGKMFETIKKKRKELGI